MPNLTCNLCDVLDCVFYCLWYYVSWDDEAEEEKGGCGLGWIHHPFLFINFSSCLTAQLSLSL